MNKVAMAGAVKDLHKLGKRLSAKMNKMPLKERQKLIEYFIPNGSFLEINWLHPDDVHLFTLPTGRRVQITRGYSYKGIFDLRAVIEALKTVDKTGTVPDYMTYLGSKNILG